MTTSKTSKQTVQGHKQRIDWYSL